MTCEKCGGKIRVVDTVHAPGNETYRKRRCNDCDHMFYTVETKAKLTREFVRNWTQCHRDSHKGGNV